MTRCRGLPTRRLGSNPRPAQLGGVGSNSAHPRNFMDRRAPGRRREPPMRSGSAGCSDRPPHCHAPERFRGEWRRSGLVPKPGEAVGQLLFDGQAARKRAIRLSCRRRSSPGVATRRVDCPPRMPAVPAWAAREISSSSARASSTKRMTPPPGTRPGLPRAPRPPVARSRAGVRREAEPNPWDLLGSHHNTRWPGLSRAWPGRPALLAREVEPSQESVRALREVAGFGPAGVLGQVLARLRRGRVRRALELQRLAEGVVARTGACTRRGRRRRPPGCRG